MTNVKIRFLRPDDNRVLFDSGNIELNRFFQRFAGQNQFRHYIGTTYIAEAEGRIIGYISISSGELTAEKLPSIIKKRLPSYPLPILRLARMAVDRRYQGQGVGTQLLKMVLKLSINMREQFGCVGVVVDAKHDAVSFYKRYGFITLDSLSGELAERPQPTPMFLPARYIEQACTNI